MSRIDCHAHQVPSRFVAAVERRGLAFPTGVIGPSDHLAAMERYGWELAVLSLPPPGPCVGAGAASAALARCANEALAEIVEAHPGRFAALAALPLTDVGAALRELEWALDELGLAGVVLYSNVGGAYLGDHRFDPVLEELQRRAAFVLLHPAEPHVAPCERLPAWLLEAPFETTRAVTSLLLAGAFERYPAVTWQLPHCGGAIPFLAGRIADARVREPDLAALLGDDPLARLRTLYYDTAQASAIPTLAATLSLVEPTQIVHGSDWPFAVLGPDRDPQPGLAALDSASRLAIDRDNAIAMATGVARHLDND